MSNPIFKKEFRISFPFLFTPQKSREPNTKGEFEEYYCLDVLVPKTDLATFEELSRQIAAKVESVKRDNNLAAGVPIKCALIKDGDKKFTSTGTPYPEYAGHWYFTAKAKKQYPPKLYSADSGVYTHLDAEKDRSEIYGGMWGKVQFHLWDYNKSGRGISINLDGFVKTRDGVKFGSNEMGGASIDPTLIFGEIEGDSML